VANASGEEGAVCRNILAGEQADGNLRFVTVKGASLKAAALVGKPDDSAGFSGSAANVAAIHPEMAGAQALDTARTDDDRIFRHNSYLRRRMRQMIR